MPEELDSDEWMKRWLSGAVTVRPDRGWCNRLWKFWWYKRLRGVTAWVRTRTGSVPLPKPVSVELPMMGGMQLCVWEPCAYAQTGIQIPGTQMTLLVHPTCNRVVGVLIQG